MQFSKKSAKKAIVISGTPWARDAEDSYYVEFRESGKRSNICYQFPVNIAAEALEHDDSRNELHRKLIKLIGNVHPFEWLAHEITLEVEEWDDGWLIPGLGVMATRFDSRDVGVTIPVDVNVRHYV